MKLVLVLVPDETIDVLEIDALGRCTRYRMKLNLGTGSMD